MVRNYSFKQVFPEHKLVKVSKTANIYKHYDNIHDYKFLFWSDTISIIYKSYYHFWNICHLKCIEFFQRRSTFCRTWQSSWTPEISSPKSHTSMLRGSKMLWITVSWSEYDHTNQWPLRRKRWELQPQFSYGKSEKLFASVAYAGMTSVTSHSIGSLVAVKKSDLLNVMDTGLYIITFKVF